MVNKKTSQNARFLKCIRNAKRFGYPKMQSIFEYTKLCFVHNKQGYIKTLEAVIAIVIILIFTFAVTPKPTPSYQLPSSVENAQNYILEEIAGDDDVRAAVMEFDPESSEEAYGLINDIVATNLPTGYAYTIGICIESACSSNATSIAEDRSVYTAEAMIGSYGVVDTAPRIVRIWMWRKPQIA